VGLDLPDSGELRAFGELVDHHSMADVAFAKRLRQRVGLVFQSSDAQLFCPSVYDEVAFGPRQMGLAEDEVTQRTNDCLALMGIEALAERTPHQLSGGERKRVAVACVISLAPRVLLIDEPTNELDEDGVKRLIAFLRSHVAAGGAVLLTTHHRDLVAAVATRVVRMDAAHRTL
jgi:cobalt/nickel transport system ATP-binding protein